MTTLASTLAIQSRTERRAALDALNAYRLLVNAGHSPFKAGTIVLQCVRGDRYALQWLDAIFSTTASEARPS